MIVPVMAISNLVLTQQIYSEEPNGAHAHYREPVPLIGGGTKKFTPFTKSAAKKTTIKRRDYSHKGTLQAFTWI